MNPGPHYLILLVLSQPQTNKFIVKGRGFLGTHEGPGQLELRVSDEVQTVTAEEGDWVGLYVIHSGKTDMIERVPGSVRRAVGVNPREGDTVDTDPTFGKNRMLPMRVFASEIDRADLEITEQQAVETTGDQLVGRKYRVKVTVRNNGPDPAVGIRTTHREPNTLLSVHASYEFPLGLLLSVIPPNCRVNRSCP